MKITINESDDFNDTEIIINCKRVDEKLLKTLSLINTFEEKIKGYKDGKVILLELKNIFYFESVDKKTFIYMDKEVYESEFKLYEIESKFNNTDFFRASKSTIINLEKIREIIPMFRGRLEVILENDEKLIVSRQYVPILKKKLGL